MHELPLVFFTVLAQASAGLLILMVINQLVCGRHLADNTQFVTGVASLIIVAVAGFCAILHLGQPFRAINSLFGTGRSPMSNEILSCGIYGGLLFISLAITYMKPALKPVILGFRLLTVIAAIVLLTLIPNVYSLITIPQWDTPYTTIEMVLAAVTTGGALAMIWLPNRLNTLVTVAGVTVGLFILPGYLAFIGHSAPERLTHGMGFWDVKYALYAIAMALTLLAYRQKTATIAASAGVLFIIAELAGRIAFYDLWSISM